VLALSVIAAAVLTAAATPLVAAYARRTGLVAPPREDRWHRAPTPLLGGVAIALGAMVVLGAALATPWVVPLLLGALAAVALGLLDDFRRLAPTTKLVGQVLVASVLVFGGIRVEIVEFPPLSFLLTVLWVVGLMNAVNLIDNMDGLAAGVAAIAGIVLGLTALPEQLGPALVAGATAGAALGFLVHNRHPARVFMGDSGSHLLGYLLAAAALLHTATGAANVSLAVLGPLAALALPLFDTVFVTTARQLAGVPITRGGRDHTSHRLAALGLSDRAAVWLLYLIAAGLGALGLVAEMLGLAALAFFALAVVGLVLFGGFLLEVEPLSSGERRQELMARSPIARGLATYGRFGIEVGLDVLLLTTAYFVSYLIRFEGIPEALYMYLFVQSLPIVVGAQLLSLVGLRVYRALWRYLSVADAVAIVRALSVGTAGGAIGVLVLYRFEGYSRAVFVLDWLIGMALIVGSRAFLLWLRDWFESRPREGARRTLIVGASDDGAMALRLLTRLERHAYQPVGFLDDDPGKRFRRISGVPVVGTVADLERSVHRLKVDVVVLALRDHDDRLLAMREICTRAGVECREFAVAL
jgi:UDP-GlcNAc:undecaprenyl-phosphate GlcNAc-1-phosphate transferase